MPRMYKSFLFGALVLALAPSALLAAPEGKGPNLLAPEYDLGIWTVVVFVLLLLVLRKAAWGPMVQGLQKREETIRGAVEEAKRTREDMERLRAESRAELAAGHAEIARMMEEARRDGAQLKEQIRAEATAENQKDRQRLRREIELARDQALQELWNQAGELATMISAKAIGKSLSADDHRRLIDEALEEMKLEAH